MSINIENTTNVLNLLRAKCGFGNLEKLSDDTNHGGHVPLVPDNNTHNVTVSESSNNLTLTFHSSSGPLRAAPTPVISSIWPQRSA